MNDIYLEGFQLGLTFLYRNITPQLSGWQRSAADLTVRLQLLVGWSSFLMASFKAASMSSLLGTADAP